MDERTRLERSRNSIDSDPLTPGVQTVHIDEAAAIQAGYERGVKDGRLWIGLAFVAGVVVACVLLTVFGIGR